VQVLIPQNVTTERNQMLATKSSEIMGMGKPLTAKRFQISTPQENAYLDAFLVAAHGRKYPAKSTFIYAGDKRDSIYFILKGLVTVLVGGESGREIIVTYLNKGDFFGEIPLFTGDSPRSAWFKGKTECEVAELSYGKFKELAEKHTELLYAVSRQMADRLCRTTQKVSDLAFLDVTGGVARTLLDCTPQEPRRLKSSMHTGR
jgi:CRP/FNR family cyclic AMP-dependent transcriptional regulator